MEEAGLTYEDLVYMSRWGAYAPRVAHLASLTVTARKKGSLQRDTADRRVGETSQSTRHASTCPLHLAFPFPLASILVHFLEHACSAAFSVERPLHG